MDAIKFARTSLHVSETPVQIPGSRMFAVEASISPKMAEDWLEKYNGRNRRLRASRANRIAQDITGGRWIVSHQAIAFDTAGQITAGQHRLTAIVKAGIEVQSLVVLNCPPEERAVIDQTAIRDVRDVSGLAYQDELSPLFVAAARTMCYGSALRIATPMTPQETYAFIQQHRTALNFIFKRISRNVPGVTTASVIGAVGRAYYHLNKPDLDRFIAVLIDGLSQKKDERPIIQLRNWLLENRDALRNTKGRSKAYLLAEAALDAYRTRTAGDSLAMPEDELFAIKSPRRAAVGA